MPDQMEEESRIGECPAIRERCGNEPGVYRIHRLIEI